MLKLLLAPLFLHVLLVSYVGTLTVRSRIESVVRGRTKIADIAVDSGAWPTKIRQYGNNFDNQFDVPMLWYAACALIVATGLVDVPSIILSWVFLVLRVAHSYIHVGSNHVPTRMRVFLASFAAVFALWAWFGLRLYVLG